MIKPGKKPSVTDYLTPGEIVDHFPEVRKFWNARQVGYLFYLKLARGRKNGEGTSFILVSDVFNAMGMIKK